MLEDADEYEDTNFAEYKKYLQSIYDQVSMERDSERDAYIDKYLVGLGMFYRSIIIHYYLAFEGFVNLLYHAFLKRELQGRKMDQRLDIDMKVLLMPGLCNGFRNEMLSPESEIFKNFLQLRDYRNEIFHSKIVDSLKHVAFVQDGFLYTVDMGKEKKESLFPPAGKTLQKEDALKVKSLVDDLIEEILNNMDDESSKLVRKFILKELVVPFWKDDTGQIRFGKFGIGDFDNI
jgi:hypothetical protein